MTDRSSLAFVFTKIGLSGGDMGTAWLLQRLVGLSAATELLMLGNPLSAERAFALNLAHRRSIRPSWMPLLSNLSPTSRSEARWVCR